MLEIFMRRVNSIAVLDLSGAIDIDSSNFIEKVGWCLDNGYRSIICNLENVSLVDFTGLSALGMAYKNCVNHKARMKLLKVPLHVRSKLELVCLDRVLDSFDDEKSAVRSFDADRSISEVQKKPLRRRFKRLPLDAFVEIKERSEGDYRKAKLLNLSGVGMLIFTEKTYPLGSVLDVKMSLKPVAESVFAETRVVWLVDKKIQPRIYPGMGLEFYHLDPLTQDQIVSYVERNLPMDSWA